MIRRGFLKTTFALGATGLIAPSAVLAGSTPEILPDGDFQITTGPYLTTSFNNSITINWFTNRNANSWVEFGTDKETLSKKAYGKSVYGFRPEKRINKVTLKNLDPGKTYYYRIVSQEIKDFQPYKLTYGAKIESEVEQFTNTDPNKQAVSFLMLNDIHDRPKSIPLLLNLDDPAKHDFVFFNGDIFDYQTDEQQIIDHMLKPCMSTFAKNKPFVYVRGNHETRGVFRDDFLGYFDNVGYQAFTLGAVRFVVLDTGEDKADTHSVYANLVDFDAYRQEQADWLADEIKSKAFKKAQYRVVLMHIPPVFGGDAPGELHVNKLFNPLLNAGKVDMVLSGHTHRYVIHQPNEGANKYPIVVGGGPTEGKRTITRINANSDRLEVVMLGDNGKEVGRYTVKG